ncbi:uncharacterized protein TNCV_693481 [Trichonephila clavipes]|nr:uncharacterized protein TNCV_693481 [Trichonephila clavipes]
MRRASSSQYSVITLSSYNLTWRTFCRATGWYERQLLSEETPAKSFFWYAFAFVSARCTFLTGLFAHKSLRDVASVAEWYGYRIVACHVTSSNPVPLKTGRVGQRCTLNLSRAETSSRWCGVVVRRGGASSGAIHVTWPWLKITLSVAKSPRVAEQKKLNYDDSSIVEHMALSSPIQYQKFLVIKKILTPSEWISKMRQLIAVTPDNANKNAVDTGSYTRWNNQVYGSVHRGTDPRHRFQSRGNHGQQHQSHMV